MPAPGKNVVAGNIEPVLQTLEIDRSATDAQQVRQVFKGETEQCLRAFDRLSTGATRARYRQSGSIAEIEIQLQTVPGEVGTPGTSSETFLVQEVSYSFNQVQVSIWDAPYFANLTATDIISAISTRDAILAVRADIAADATALEAEAASLLAYEERQKILQGLIDQYDSPTDNVISLAMDLLLRDAAPPVIFLPVLTYRTVVAANSALTLASEITGTIFTTAELEDYIPSTKYDGNPLRSRIPQPATTNSAIRTFTSAGWLAQAQANPLSDGSMEFLQTFTYGFYPLAYTTSAP